MTDSQEALLDTMAAFPRALFSGTELEVSRWLARELGVHGMPSVREVRNHCNRILTVAGVPTETVTSAHGNVYTYNSMEEIIRHVSHDVLYSLHTGLCNLPCEIGIRQPDGSPTHSHLSGGVTCLFGGSPW